MSKHKKEEALRAKAREIAKSLGAAMPPGVGFTLFLFETGGPGSLLTYISSAGRDDMIEVVKEWLALQEALKKEPGHV